MKQIIKFLLFIINFEIIFSYFGELINSTLEPKNEETTHFSREKDMGPCTCNLTNHCDYRCCCDSDCSNDIIKDWNEKGFCLDYHNNRINDNMCESIKDNFNYNKKKATMKVKDHIYNIMCIQFDNSGDMEEYYLDEPKSDDNIVNDWIESFFTNDNQRRRNLEDNNSLKYGVKLESLTLYDILKGKCIKNIYFLKTFEFECKEVNNKDNEKIIKYGNGEHIQEITEIIDYDNNNNIKEKVKILYGNKNLNKPIKIKIQWNNINANLKRAYPYGYQQGKPIKIAIVPNNSEKENPQYFYKSGYFIEFSNKDGNCIKTDDKNNVANIYPILFKKNVIYSCKVEGEAYKNTNIYYIFQNANTDLYIGRAPNSTLTNLKNNNEWILLDKINPNNKDLNKNDIYIYLIILTSKEGKENNPYEIIRNAKLIINSKPKKEEEDPIISFSVKYIDVSYSSIMNSKNDIITSFTSSFFKDL